MPFVPLEFLLLSLCSECGVGWLVGRLVAWGDGSCATESDTVLNMGWPLFRPQRTSVFSAPVSRIH